MIILQNNLLAQNAHRQLNITTTSMAKNAEKLSSGYRINRAADDAAGLAISEKMRRQIRGLTQGVQNTQEGIGLCQVADGALAEVNEMLHRITELSVKSANGTNTESDRQAIHQEVIHLLQEIDRISDTTTYNDQYIFRGSDTIMYNPDGSVMTEGSIPFSDFTLADMDLGFSPFGRGSSAYTLQLQAIVDNPDSVADGMVYGLIFGGGSTSSSSIRLKYIEDGEEKSTVVPFNSLTPENYADGLDENENYYWTRDFIYKNDDGVGIKITQKIVADDSGDEEKNYRISYLFENIGDVEAGMDFMFHVDTAYNNNDICEGYYVNGQRIRESRVYNGENSHFTGGQTNNNILNGIPGSISIVDEDRALAFSEKISFLDQSKPDSVSIGYYYSINDWDYYNSLDGNLGQDLVDRDLGFSLMWHIDMEKDGSKEVGFSYGITSTENDPNLTGVGVQLSKEPLIKHGDMLQLWIHSGSEAGVGQWLELEEMNTGILGISRVDVSTVQGANTALVLTKGALEYVARLRSNMGAQQNRLEHTVNNENNIVENTTDAESHIRDTDIARAMAEFANQNILSQTGTSMLAQANQQPNFALQLLQ